MFFEDDAVTTDAGSDNTEETHTEAEGTEHTEAAGEGEMAS
jgi:hypothetical protein